MTGQRPRVCFLIAAALAILAALQLAPAPAAASSTETATLTAPWNRATVTDHCRQYDEVFGPDAVLVDDTIRCTFTTRTADAATGDLATDVSLSPAAAGGFGRGDSYPNSIVSSYHRLKRPAAAVQYTFRFEVINGGATVSDHLQAYASLKLFARAASAKCSCEVRNDHDLVSANGVGGAQPGIVTITLLLQNPSGDPIPAGDVLVQGNLVPFMIVAAPPRQLSATVPSQGAAHVQGSARLLDVVAQPLG